MLLAKLQELDAIRTVGEPTGGSAEGPTAGLIFFLALPHSALADFLAERDPVLEAALALDAGGDGRADER